MLVLTPQQMREADAKASGIAGAVTLMRSAGERIAEIAQRYARSPRVVAFAGPGNNGGDAFAALALLDGYDRVVYADESPEPSAARRDAQERARAAGVRTEPFPRSPQSIRAALQDAGLAVVGLVGTGARLPLPDAYCALISAINDSDVPSIAIDIPPGIDGERGAAVEPALRATATITLGAVKTGLLLPPGCAHAGDLWLGDIGMPPEVLAAAARRFWALDDDEFLDLLPSRSADSDKRSAGAVLVVAGSEQFPGAAVLAVMGAARAGAGYVTLATPAAAANAVRMHLVEQVVVTMESAEDLLDVSKRCTSVAIGPGLGLNERTGEIVREFVRACELPIVADASALFHFAKHLEMLRGKRIVVTPHEKEFARLSGGGTVKPGERLDRLREFVLRTGITTLLKGRSTLVYDGKTVHINTSGTAALATAGTGDVLTGIIATLAGRRGTSRCLLARACRPLRVRSSRARRHRARRVRGFAVRASFPLCARRSAAADILEENRSAPPARVAHGRRLSGEQPP
jgi:hydroxyethylthiazole kinase-like uncharacterized protein yjeF